MVKRTSFKLIIKKIESPFSENPQDKFNWICESFGLFHASGKEKAASFIFRELIRAAEEDRKLALSDLVEISGLSRGAITNHLNNLLLAGMIVKQGRFYYARSKSVYRIIEEIEQDLLRIFSELKKNAIDIDTELGIRRNSK
ncbi:MAG: helix-turn-helix domain-containing protein [Candidatus Diapherotrites archaeon]